MTPAARIAAAIDLLEVIEGAPARPADAVASDFFRSRRYIGSGDRRAVSERVWTVLRGRRRLGWWLKDVRHSARPSFKTIVPNATHSNYFRVIASPHCDNVGMWNICGPVLLQRGDLRPV